MGDWRVLERKDRVDLSKAGDAKLLELTVRMAWQDLDPDLDPKEVRRMAFRQLKRIVQKWDEEEWIRQTSLTAGPKDQNGADEGPYHVPAAEKRPPRPKLQWQKPDLPKRDIDACHKLLEGLLLLGVHGRAVSTGDLVKNRKIGARVLYRILDPDSDAYQYLRPYIHDMKSRGRRLLDLTPEGRQLASQIRVGALPT